MYKWNQIIMVLEIKIVIYLKIVAIMRTINHMAKNQTNTLNVIKILQISWNLKKVTQDSIFSVVKWKELTPKKINKMNLIQSNIKRRKKFICVKFVKEFTLMNNSWGIYNNVSNIKLYWNRKKPSNPNLSQ